MAVFKRPRQARLLRSAIRKALSGGEVSAATADISKYSETDREFANILGVFVATLEDVEACIMDMIAAGVAWTSRGRYIPVYAILSPLTRVYRDEEPRI
jgi:hypothetical protein